MGDANELVTAFSTVGATVAGVISVVVAWGKAREMVNKPIDDLKASLTSQITGLDAKITALRKDADALNVHFDPNGADIRGKLHLIEKRLSVLETATVNERAELKGLLTDLRPIIHELRERL